MINYQKRLKKVSLFIRYNLVTKNNLKLTKTWKYILVFHCSLSKGADSLEEFVWDRGRIFSDRNIAFDYMINYQTLLKKILVRVSYTNWLLRTTTDTHKKDSSYLLLIISPEHFHFWKCFVPQTKTNYYPIRAWIWGHVMRGHTMSPLSDWSDPSENDLLSSVLNCNNPTGLFTLINGRD